MDYLEKAVAINQTIGIVSSILTFVGVTVYAATRYSNYLKRKKRRARRATAMPTGVPIINDEFVDIDHDPLRFRFKPIQVDLVIGDQNYIRLQQQYEGQMELPADPEKIDALILQLQQQKSLIKKFSDGSN